MTQQPTMNNSGERARARARVCVCVCVCVDNYANSHRIALFWRGCPPTIYTSNAISHTKWSDLPMQYTQHCTTEE